MASFTSKRNKSLVVDPQVATVVPVQPEQPQEAQEGGRKRKRTHGPRYTGGRADGKPARGLVATPADYVSAKESGRLSRGQFKTAEFWYTHCAEMARREVERYTALAADASANPAKYARSSGTVVKAQLVAQISKLEAALAARGYSAEDIAALVAGQ